MAPNLFLLSTLSFLLLSTFISARPGIPFHPCNTLIISTFSFSLPNPNNPNNPNNPSNPNNLIFSLRPLNHHHRFFRHQIPDLPLRSFHPNLNDFLADKTQITNLPLRSSFHPIPVNLPNDISHLPLGSFNPRLDNFEADKTEMTDLPLGFSSMRDRTKDILSVVASLLFGAACGALTAGTMYLVWSIVNYRHGSNYRSIDGFSSESDSDDDDIFNPKKNHYVAIPVDVGSIKEKDVDAVIVAKETA